MTRKLQLPSLGNHAVTLPTISRLGMHGPVLWTHLPCRTLLGSHLIWNVVTGMMVETSLPLVFFVVGFVVLFGSHAERLMGALQYGACLLFATFVPGTMISMGALFFYISTQREKFLCVGVSMGGGGGAGLVELGSNRFGVLFFSPAPDLNLTRHPPTFTQLPC